jgi:para-nitrobenzyl esterase
MPTFAERLAQDWRTIDRRRFLASAGCLAGTAAAGALFPGWTRWALATAAADAPMTSALELRSGRTRGRTLDGVHTFLGLPYGGPTGGARRFLAPVREDSWTGVRDAFEYGPHAPQSGRARGAKQRQFFAVLGSASTKGASEDCLYLNVWTRGLGDGGKRPIMVWLHGGGYDQGAGGSVGYAGESLAKQHDVVAVTINHRLNVLGYAYLGGILGGEFAASANQGQQDIVAALRWVREHAEVFGGDPSRVMIYGQSGGAGKVVTLLGMPGAKGLFHAAAVQSGGARGGAPDQATESALALLAALGLGKDNAREIQNVPLDRLMEIGAGASTGAAPGSPGFRFGPVIDGTVLPKDPNESDLSRHVPVIQGATRTERTVYEIDSSGFGQLGEAELTANVTRLVGAERAAAVIARYREEKPKATPYALDHYISTDVRAPGALALRRNRMGGAPTWVYRWDWETPVMDLLAPHTMEIPFVMSHIDACTSMTGPVSEAMRQLEAQTSGAWVALARSGDPNHPGLPQWPAHDEASKAVMLFDTPCRVVNDPGAELRSQLVPGAVGGRTFGPGV